MKAALRHRPDRIILGEIRGGTEARTLLDAMNTAHPGTLSTIHSTNAQGALRRLAMLATRCSQLLAIHDAQNEVRYSVQMVVPMERLEGRRYVADIHVNNR